MRILDTKVDNVFALLRRRTVQIDEATERVVRSIIADVRQRGDAALLENGRRFDSEALSSIEVSPEEFADSGVSAATLAAFDTIQTRVEAFHRAQIRQLFPVKSVFEGATWEIPVHPPGEPVLNTYVGQRYLSLRSVGVYVPGGQAVYPSSVFMNVIPALVAGVQEVVVTTPARSDGKLHPAVLAALKKVGVRAAFKAGGAAAIAALAFGTESVPRVDKIVGPGNRFVNEAKRQLWGQVGLDGFAGSSEVCVVVDETVNAAYAAADLLTQVEHAPDNCGFLVALSREKLDTVLAEVERQLAGAPRESTMRQALQGDSVAIVARDLPEAIDIVNAIAPEHLSLAGSQAEEALNLVQNAGSIFLGEFTPESAGDYCLGPSHTLPTGGAARWQSPVNVLDFLKIQSIAKLTREELVPLIPLIETMGEIEGFPAHAFGALIRRG